MTERPPAEVRDLATARATARAARNWAEADRLRAEIEAAGWRVIDHGTQFELHAARPPDVVEASGRVRYGSSAAVPSRLAEPAAARATLVVRTIGDAPRLERLLDAIRRSAPAGLRVVIVADDPDAEAAAALDAPDGPASRPVGVSVPEVVWTAERLGVAGALNAGLRRAVGAVVVLIDPSVEPDGDLVSPLVASLEDSSVAVVGGRGWRSTDLRHWEEAPVGEVDAVDLGLMAFRRADLVARGPLDERFRTERFLAAWWSLVLRDEGEGSPPRRAVQLADLPVVRHARGGAAGPEVEGRDRDERRDYYRLLDRFGGRPDLLVGPGPSGDPPAEATERAPTV